MKPILVHLHIFYKELYPELKECLQNISDHKFELFVTMVQAHQDIIDDLNKSFPGCKIQIVPNVGFDIAPFFSILKKINLDDFSYVIKFHTKRDVKDEGRGDGLEGSTWRDLLLDFAKSKDNFNFVVKNLEEHPNIGMHGDVKLIWTWFYDGKQEIKKFPEFLKVHGYKKLRYLFVGGSMYIARASVFKDMQKLDIKQEEFEAPDLSHTGCQLAHLLERFIGYSVYNHGMSIKDCTITPLKSNLKYFTRFSVMVVMGFIKKWILSIRVTKKNKLLIKVLRIPVFSWKLNNRKL